MDADAGREALVRRRLAGEAGQSSVEFAGTLVLLFLGALALWQVTIVMWSYTQASNAARTASRVLTRGGDSQKAARNALSPVLRRHLRVDPADPAGEKVTVHVLIPIVVPGMFSEHLRATRSAVLPR